MVSQIVILCFGLVLFVSCAQRPRNNDDVKAQLHLEIGTTHFLKGNYPLALKELLAAERFNPLDFTIQNNLGLTYLMREKFDEAEIHLKKALELNKGYTDARNNLGRLYIQVGLYDQAIQNLELAATDLTYEQPEKSWANLGQAYFLIKSYNKAKEALEKSLRARRENCFTMNYYGRTLFELKNYPAAAESLDQAIKFCEKSNFEEPYFYSGLSFYKAGQIEKARGRFREVIVLFPSGNYVKEANAMLEIIK